MEIVGSVLIKNVSGKKEIFIKEIEMSVDKRLIDAVKEGKFRIEHGFHNGTFSHVSFGIDHCGKEKDKTAVTCLQKIKGDFVILDSILFGDNFKNNRKVGKDVKKEKLDGSKITYKFYFYNTFSLIRNSKGSFTYPKPQVFHLDLYAVSYDGLFYIGKSLCSYKDTYDPKKGKRRAIRDCFDNIREGKQFVCFKTHRKRVKDIANAEILKFMCYLQEVYPQTIAVGKIPNIVKEN